MGRRKERRLAAISAAGRRVKLDLFAEPTGEVASASKDAEVGRDLDQEERAGIPSSPSSSGQKPDNALLLLGQYSDDEVDDDAGKRAKLASQEEASSSTDADGKVNEIDETNGDTGCSADKEMVSNNLKSEEDYLDVKSNLENNDVENTDIIPEVDPCSEVHSMTQICDANISGMQIVGDAGGGWKIVMHEESNQCYYWNTLTGETSWEVPDVLSQSMLTTGEQKSSLLPDSNTESITYADGVGIISERTNEYVSGLPAGKENGAIVNMVYDASQTMPNYGTSGISGFYGAASEMHDLGFQQAIVSSEQLASREICIPQGTEDRDGHLLEPHASYETTDSHSAQLIRQFESLLEKLKAHEGSGNNLDSCGWTLKYVTEVETRLSDCKALSSFGSFILPFWWHTKTQLKRLESVIGRDAPHIVNSGGSEVNGGNDSSVKAGSEPVESVNAPLTAVENACVSDTSIAKECWKEEKHLNPEKCFVESEKYYSGSPCQLSECGEAIKHPAPSHLIPKVDSHASEEIDMDVEMEVDEEIPASHQDTKDSLSIEYPDPSEQPIPPNSLAEVPTIRSDELSVPPPPDEEWIPPPPPDSELVPPPPPEEPPSVPPPPSAEIAQPLPYVEQYSLGFSVPSFQYYNPTASEAQSTNYYGHVDGSHIAEPQPPQYYEPAAPSSYPNIATVVSYSNVATVVPVETSVYYDVQSATIPTGSAIMNLDPSVLYTEFGTIGHPDNPSTSDHPASAVFYPGAGSVNLHSEKVGSDFSSVASETEKNVAVNAAAAAAKNPSKVSRSKKRAVAVAPTLRSNKKVSSLVDKWKAAKEELHEDEDDEPENAIEILEKKRKKEIEEWRARQIASGEAQDNANFLPLGGDWRERVKRRRAESKAESVKTPPEEAVNEKKQPDLAELSKGLPSGWQVYWDESSKGVYYGNINTSDTTWTRPSS